MTGGQKQTGSGEGGEIRGDYGAGTSLAGALAHVPCCHTKGGYHSRWPQGRRGRRENFFFFPLVGWHALALVGPIWAMGGRKGKGTALPTLRQGVISGVFRIKGASPGPSLGLRSCNSQCFSPMPCHLISGMLESMPCPLCGQM